MEHSDDEAAVRRAVADILVCLSNGRVTEERLSLIRRKMEEAAAAARGEDAWVRVQRVGA